MSGAPNKKPGEQPDGRSSNVPVQTMTGVKGTLAYNTPAAIDTTAGIVEKYMDVPSSSLSVGFVIDGRYQIEGQLGEGGMGVVYKARHTTLNKMFAIKVLRSDVSKNQEVLDRFVQEAQSASAIGNQHIIDISDFGTLSDGSTYFVMEYLQGKSLSEALAKGETFPTERLVLIARQLCEAISAAHEAGIVHRDLKPDNVMLVARGSTKDFVKVLDFGIAKVGSAANKLTKAGQVVGTPHYMSPEQCSAKNIDHRTDIYSIGVILYEMASGKVPFDADSLMGVLTQHVYSEPEPLAKRSPPHPVPGDLEAIILKCLAKSPDGRYPTVAALHEDLNRFASGRSLVMPSGVTVTFNTGELRPIVRQGSMTRKWAMVGALAVVVLGIVVWFSSSSEPQAKPEAKPAANAAVAPQAPVPEAAKVKLITEPAGAEVYRNGILLGGTPLDVDKPADAAPVEISIKLDGYQEKLIKITRDTSAALSIRLSAVVKDVPKPAASGGGKGHGGHHAPKAGGGSGGAAGGGDIADPWN